MCKERESCYACFHLEITGCLSWSLVQGDQPVWKRCALYGSQRCVLVCGMLPCSAARKRALIWVKSGTVILSGLIWLLSALIWLILFIPQEWKVLRPHNMCVFMCTGLTKKKVSLHTEIYRICCSCLCWSAWFVTSFQKGGGVQN